MEQGSLRDALLEGQFEEGDEGEIAVNIFDKSGPEWKLLLRERFNREKGFLEMVVYSDNCTKPNILIAVGHAYAFAELVSRIRNLKRARRELYKSAFNNYIEKHDVKKEKNKELLHFLLKVVDPRDG